MINKILIPTDFSDVANNALKYALELASKSKASVTLLHIRQIPLSDPSFPAETFQMYLNEIETFEKEQSEKLTETLLKPSGIPFEFCSATGFVGDEVVRITHEKNIDLIVMGTTGASGIAELLVGSNAASVIGKADIPVLVVPPGKFYQPITHILYATDFNEPEFPAFSRLMFFAELYDAKLSIVHVKGEFDQFFNAANNFFKRNKENITRDYTLVNVDGKNVMEAIDEKVDELHADLLVMAKHNRSFFDRLFHRSLSKRMAYHTKIPLLVLHK